MEATKKGTSLLRHVLPQYPIALVLMLNFNASFNGPMINFYKPKNLYLIASYVAKLSGWRT